MNARVLDQQTVEEPAAGEAGAESEFDSLLRSGAVSAPAKAAAADATAAPGAGTSPVIEADVDGKRVRVVAQDEIVLQCGQASITLRRNGRIEIRGTHVETCSEGTNRIKGGQVRIN